MCLKQRICEQTDPVKWAGGALESCQVHSPADCNASQTHGASSIRREGSVRGWKRQSAEAWRRGGITRHWGSNIYRSMHACMLRHILQNPRRPFKLGTAHSVLELGSSPLENVPSRRATVGPVVRSQKLCKNLSRSRPIVSTLNQNCLLSC